MNKIGLYSNTARSVNHLRDLATNNPTNTTRTSPNNSSSVDGVELSSEAEQLLKGGTPGPLVLGIPSPPKPNSPTPGPLVLGIPGPTKPNSPTPGPLVLGIPAPPKPPVVDK